MDQDAPRPGELAAGLVVARIGSLVSTDDASLPWEVLGGSGLPVEPVSEFLSELVACGNTAASCRSYAYDLLRWFRFRFRFRFGFDFEAERDRLRLLPADDYDCGIDLTPTVARNRRITVRQGYYSVPRSSSGRRCGSSCGRTICGCSTAVRSSPATLA
ncbi:hypothetical protein ACFVT2_41935 [Streptomyces sp. NPDC058000]|uniref:hypothetical protein n=1 Tax=Streptomyces sp. NPDC058000 TaxID=3346299 RepID=UPI0036F0FA7D